MKIILTISLILIGMTGLAQPDYLIKRNYQLDSGDTGFINKYEYNEDFTVKQVQVYYEGEIVATSLYENDTMIRTDNEESYNTYEYYNDSITITYWYDGNHYVSAVYYLDEEDHTVHAKIINGPLNDIYNIWDNDNIVEQSYIMFDELHKTIIDYHDYLNPLYNPNKYLQSDIPSCYNYPKSFKDTTGVEVRYFDVIETLGNYPTKVEVYTYGEYDYDIRFEFKVISAIKETEPSSFTLISKDYFDMMGRKIPKPNKGFYIERLTTDKGVISKKYFIQ